MSKCKDCGDREICYLYKGDGEMDCKLPPKKEEMKEIFITITPTCVRYNTGKGTGSDPILERGKDKALGQLVLNLMVMNPDCLFRITEETV